MNETGIRIEIQGTVQGVGFRPWVWRLARENGIAGRVSNDSRGVTIDAFGRESAIESFLLGIRTSPPPAAEIRAVESRPIPPEPGREFVIVSSRETEGLRVSLPPDMATCDACLSEIFDPGDRRYRYAFTNCTNCGPRFTIAEAVPYDRPATTMSSFPMCPDCRREYEDPADRRFHAQPNACPVCGPRLSLLSASATGARAAVGEPVRGADPIDGAAAILLGGGTVAIKGLGGFHLACDARSSRAVDLLRRRKRREEKPFAVMVRTIEEAEKLAILSDDERALLSSRERPIVLVVRREDSRLAPEVAPDNPFVGLMLAYTPLHHLLLEAAGRPLVMTSGNLSEEPIACGNAEALARLGRLADGFLVHDREIASRCDDSVARVVAGGPMLMRRSRGWVPREVPVAVPFAEPVLACGAHLKNTFAIGLGSSAYLGPHIGDLENLETLGAFEDAVARMEKFLRVEAKIIAHDLHPEYASTDYARRRDGRRIAVQHHHAHVASAMAEHGIAGRAIGVAYDGTGYGTDGTAWGGEILVADFGEFERIATWRPVPLAGGEAAIREPWRVALALLEDAFPEGAPTDRLPLFDRLGPRAVAVVRKLVAERIHTPLARGVGRYFDGFGALFLGRPFARHEGQVALAWNVAANPDERRAYAYAITRSQTPWELDLRPTVRAAVADFLAGAPPATISGRFHETVAAATAALVHHAVETRGDLPVVLTGGCFQNSLLAERSLDHLGRSGIAALLQRRVPTGDGGIALGQAVVAAARCAKGSAAAGGVNVHELVASGGE
ncbi:MAG TPA: carbamoyltransferase HypF [Thermoanaerobaculia bacterium]|nr:carbamoyltransferase HypF [Thermoanaerobaculia bacterium]